MYIWIFIVPISAKVLEKTHEIAEITIYSYTFEVTLSLPFSWKIFYFAALSFAIATIIYQTRCPRLIKEHPTFASYENEGKPEWLLRDYATDIKVDYNEYRHNQVRNYEAHETSKFAENKKEGNQMLFWGLYSQAETERTKERHLCFVFYFVGFLLMSIVFIQNFNWVLSNVIRTF